MTVNNWFWVGCFRGFIFWLLLKNCIPLSIEVNFYFKYRDFFFV